ncbi:Rap1a/Tai family immunity protein [Bradyrhizobium sp. 190]|uniref:Rap1a/Tai family immunity protein n=1 Tax=Bradyrhizobium sp. 190 TaxID=2782658 RepID=UPI0035ABB640
MRAVWIVVASSLSFAAPAHSLESANELLSSCERFLAIARIDGNRVSMTRNEPPAFECWGYLGAFQELSAIRHDGEKIPITRACLPAESSLVQLIRVFVSYAQKHPEDLHQRAGLVALEALQAAFPCRKS